MQLLPLADTGPVRLDITGAFVWPQVQDDNYSRIAINKIPVSPIGPVGWPGHHPSAFCSGPAIWRRTSPSSGSAYSSSLSTSISPEEAKVPPVPQTPIGQFYSFPRYFSLNIPFLHLSPPSVSALYFLNNYEGFHLLRYQSNFPPTSVGQGTTHWTLQPRSITSTKAVLPEWYSIYRRTPVGAAPSDVDNLTALTSQNRHPATQSVWKLTYAPEDKEHVSGDSGIDGLTLPPDCWVLSAYDPTFPGFPSNDNEFPIPKIRAAWIKQTPEPDPLSSLSSLPLSIFDPTKPQIFEPWYAGLDGEIDQLPTLTIKPWMW